MKKTMKIAAACLLVVAIAFFSLFYFRASSSLLVVYACNPDSEITQTLAFIFLKMKSPDPNQIEDGASPLQYSLDAYKNAESEDRRETAKKVVKWLLSRGGDLNRPGPSGLTPMHDAVWGSGDYMQFLLAEGADPNAKAGPGRFADQTPLAFAYRMQRAAYKNRLKNPNYIPSRYDKGIQLLKEAKAHE